MTPTHSPSSWPSNGAAKFTAIWLDSISTWRTFWRFTYDWLASREQDSFTVMNLGYASETETPEPGTDPEDYCLALYRRVAGGVDLQGRSLLEVGCGRAGGLAHVKQHFAPGAVTGIDLSKRAVALASERTAQLPDFTIVQGDALSLPFVPASFDVVMNIESSHCYPSRPEFFAEVYRVLRVGGHFLYTDFFHIDSSPDVREMLADAGFEICKEEDISANVVLAMRLDEPRRLGLLDRVPRVFHRPLRHFVGATGTLGYRGFSEGWLKYRNFILKRTTS